MTKIEIPWSSQLNGSTFSIQLSNWCEENGLIQGIDYRWHFIPDQKVTVFYFEDNVEGYATLMQLKWAGNEV